MKRLAGSSLILGLLRLPIPAQAQVLTQAAADCALDVINFRAWAVTGMSLIISPEMLGNWRNYLAYRYPMLSDRDAVANACWELDVVAAKWPQMAAGTARTWQNMWATSLPELLAFIEPVFPAEAQQLRAALQSRAAQQYAAPSATQNRNPVEAYETEQAIKRGLNSFNYNATQNTIGLMHSLSGQRGR